MSPLPPRRFRLALAATMAVAVSGTAPGAQGQHDRLPDTAAFLQKVRERLDHVWPPPLDAAYCDRWEDQISAHEPRTWIYELHPAPPGVDRAPYLRLVYDKDQAVDAARVAREDRYRAPQLRHAWRAPRRSTGGPRSSCH